MSRDILNYSKLDRELWGEMLEDFIPRNIFDAHCHLWNNVFTTSATVHDNDWHDHNTSMEDLDSICKMFFPERTMRFLCFSTPVKNADYDGLNEWVNTETSSHLNSFAAMLTTPEMSGKYVHHFLHEHPRFIALKPYYSHSGISKPDLCDYLPEPQMEVANQHQIAVVIHLPDDPERSLSELKRCAMKYPGIKWIMAHCAACFQPKKMNSIIHTLSEIPNLYYDNAVITDSAPLELLLRYTDRKKIMFGSDTALVLGGCRRGRRLDDTGFKLPEKFMSHITFRVYEQLLAMRLVCQNQNMDKNEINDLFYGNAAGLFQSIHQEKSKI